MKRFIFKVFTFGLVLCVTLIGLIYIWGAVVPRILQKNIYYRPAGNGHTLTRLREADTAKHIDVLVIGSSHAYRGIDPRIFAQEGLKIFNLGTSSQTPIQTLYLVNEYIDKFKPKMVIYEVYYNTFQADGVEAALDLYSNVKHLDKPLFGMAKELNNIKSYNTLLYAVIDKTILGRKYKEPIIKGMDTYIKGGYVDRKVTEFKSDNSYKSTKLEINPLQDKAFKEIVNKLKRSNIQTVLIQAPITKSFYHSISNTATLDHYFRSIPFCSYFNFNIGTNFKDNLFFDSHHLNQNGVKLFDAMLLDSLRKKQKI